MPGRTVKSMANRLERIQLQAENGLELRVSATISPHESSKLSSLLVWYPRHLWENNLERIIIITSIVSDVSIQGPNKRKGVPGRQDVCSYHLRADERIHLSRIRVPPQRV